MKNRQERQQNQQNQEVNRDRSMDQDMGQGDMNRSDAGKDIDTTESDIGVS